MTTGLTRLRLAGGAQGFNWLPVFVAEEQGLFAANGLQIDYLRLGSVDKATAAVRDEEAELAITPPEGAIADYLAGGPLRIVASNSERLPMSLVARPGIANIAELRGKRVATSSLTEGTAIYTRIMLERAGLHYPRDYDFVLAGVHPARWAAMQRGEADAAPQPAPWNFLAEREGYAMLGEVADAIPEIVFAALIGSAPWLDAHEEPVGRLVATLTAAHAFINDPVNDAVTLPIYQRLTIPDDPELAARGLAYTRELGMWPSGLRVSANALATSVDVMIRTGLIATDQHDQALQVVDPRFTAAD